MVTIQMLKYQPIKEIIKILGIDQFVTVDLRDLGLKLDVSVLPFGETQIKDTRIICAFVTNDKGRSCIFYKKDLLEDKDFLAARLAIVQAFARYILTGKKNFFITQSTDFSSREKQLVYEMLMPEEQVKKMLDKLILPTTLSLAKIFDVSQAFVLERLDVMEKDTLIAGYDF